MSERDLKSMEGRLSDWVQGYSRILDLNSKHSL